MTEPPSSSEAREAARIRRRWITLGELLAIAAVLISALTLWNSYSERSQSEVEKTAVEKRADSKVRTLLLKATADRRGETLTLTPTSDEQIIQGQTISFPSALGLAPVETTGNPRIEVKWLADGLKTARRAAGRKDESMGDERLPIAIATRFLADGAVVEDHAVYDLGYAIEDRFLQGSAVRLRGLSLASRTDAAKAPALLDRLWKQRQPTISSGAKK